MNGSNSTVFNENNSCDIFQFCRSDIARSFGTDRRTGAHNRLVIAILATLAVTSTRQTYLPTNNLHVDERASSRGLGLGGGNRRRLGLEREHLNFVRAACRRVHVVTALHVFGQVGLGAETLAAHRTLERLFAGVHALVIQQRRVRPERFRTVRALEPLVAPRARLLVVRRRLQLVLDQPQTVVVHPLVLQQVALGPERLGAQLARKRFFPGVHPLVVFQRGHRPELLAAVRTLPVRAVRTVVADVRDELRLGREVFVALFTSEHRRRRRRRRRRRHRRRRRNDRLRLCSLRGYLFLRLFLFLVLIVV
ncbi:hypothetical protein AGLY_004204 [Aphis glycines]|uniref:Uncharacterized protein n=1 Tax=Aphis glycines TaxID=307491 RepID=A0A6G0TXD9_APHGL|nr:hypothetical protein AGLY_004204 [Aphis glycines]